MKKISTNSADARGLDPFFSRPEVPRSLLALEGERILTGFGLVAEMELTFIKERQRAGIDATMKVPGKYLGRPVKLDHAKVLQMRKDGKGATEISRAGLLYPRGL